MIIPYFRPTKVRVCKAIHLGDLRGPHNGTPKPNLFNPEKYTQPCEISLNIAEYTTFKKNMPQLYKLNFNSLLFALGFESIGPIISYEQK
jgi:hypothetical protein